MFFLVIFASLFLFQAAVCEEDETEFALNYLSNFGYTSHSRSGSNDAISAIKKFQEFFGLPVTGRLDERTLEEMRKPRCGVKDLVVGKNSMRVKRYYTWWTKWRKTSLKYYMTYGDDMSESKQARIIAKAFKMWSDAAPKLRFTRTFRVSEADIKVSFGRREHYGVPGEGKCFDPFDGKSGMFGGGLVLAHAFFPENGRLHFDDDEKFTEEGSIWGAKSLIHVAVHEIGHILGLRHSDVKGSVMWPTASRGTPKLHDDDIKGIRSLYGMLEQHLTPNHLALLAPGED